ncbi:hypothetical protein F4804DRAFT_333815 [Jackrogersella minutella]|nr:hypothetical protein F4804DRAFT_333815 [Jackrogersella minutella]
MKAFVIAMITSLAAGSTTWLAISSCACDADCLPSNITVTDNKECFALPLAAQSWYQNGPEYTCALFTEPSCGGARAGLMGCAHSDPGGCCFDKERTEGAVGPWISAQCLPAFAD